MRSDNIKSELFSKIFFWSICFAVCTLLVFSFINISGVNNLYRAHFRDMIYGTAYRPYVSRILIPGTVRLLTNLIPDHLQSTWNIALEGSPTLKPIFIKFKSENGMSIEAIITWLLMFLSLVGYSASFRKLLESQYRTSTFTTDISTIASLLMLVVFFGFGYIYDFTTLFLFTLELNWIARKKFKLLLLTFPIVCLNKETSILLILLMAFYGWNMLPRGVLAKIISIQSAIFIVIKSGIDWMFRTNPGSASEFHLYDHFTFALKFPTLLFITTMIFLGISYLVVKGWKYKPLFLRKGLILLLPLVGLYFVFGFPMEFRAMYEVYPIVFGLAFPTVIPRVLFLETI